MPTPLAPPLLAALSANPVPAAELAEKTALVAAVEPFSVPTGEFIDLNPAPLHATLAAKGGLTAGVKPNV